jgi:hypothetical protein
MGKPTAREIARQAWLDDATGKVDNYHEDEQGVSFLTAGDSRLVIGDEMEDGAVVGYSWTEYELTYFPDGEADTWEVTGASGGSDDPAEAREYVAEWVAWNVKQ